MPVSGDLQTMSLMDLLQWAAVTQKTGVLELERHKASRRIEFRKGFIAACSADDPASRLGQFLLGRGQITKEQLHEALAKQETCGHSLGFILVQMGTLNRKDLARLIAIKAEETIQGLFEWEDAVFRFWEGATLDPDQIEVRLSVNDVLLKGLQHQDELKMIRQVFTSSGVVLERTEQAMPPEVQKGKMARRIFELIDGKRTMTDVLLQAHATEFLVLKLLYKLYQKGLFRIKEAREADSESRTLLDPLPPPAAATQFPLSAETDTDTDTTDIGELNPLERVEEKRAARRSKPEGDSELAVEIEVATRLMRRGEHIATLELLNATRRAHPGDESVKSLIAKTERAYVEQMSGHELRSNRVPAVLELDDDTSHEDLNSDETFLLTLIDGTSDIKSLVWLSPLREVEIFMALRGMLDKGVIELRSPVPNAAA